jgi:hypothetical protein
MLIVNSRQDLGRALSGTPPLDLEPLKPNDAEQLLRHLSGTTAKWREGDARKLVLEICCCNPLMITLIGGFIAQKRCTPRVRHCWVGGESFDRSGQSTMVLRMLDVHCLGYAVSSCLPTILTRIRFFNVSWT